ncbi:hypothetical protein P3S68_018240 [Capsicum galapagoense]
MDQNLPVDAITTETTDWTCKVQVVDKFRSRISSDSFVHFQTVLVQDESEQQVSIVLYGDDILKYENLFGFFETYLVLCAKVREPHSYSIRAGTYEWVADRYTIVEAVTNNNGLEAPFPAPTKLDTLSFSAIEQQRQGVEFDLLGVVVNCSIIQYTTDQSKHFREAIVINQSKKPFLFTIRGDLANNEGDALLHHLHEYPMALTWQARVKHHIICKCYNALQGVENFTFK